MKILSDIRRTFILVFFLVLCTLAGAKGPVKVACIAETGDSVGLRLSAMYTDNMVIQRNEPIRFSGKAGGIPASTFID